MTNHIKNVIDASSVLVVISAWAQVLSPILTVITTIAALVWTGIRIYEWWKKGNVLDE